VAVDLREVIVKRLSYYQLNPQKWLFLNKLIFGFLLFWSYLNKKKSMILPIFKNDEKLSCDLSIIE